MSVVQIENEAAYLVVSSRTLGAYRVQIDLEDAGRVSEHNWHAHKERSGVVFFRANLYRAGGKQSVLLLHRFLMNARAEMKVFHKSPDTLDCRKSNLLVGTKEQQLWATYKPTKNYPTYKGVSGWDQFSRKHWTAHLRVNGVMKWLGRHMTEEEAAKAYDAAAKKYHGEYAYLNFPDS